MNYNYTNTNITDITDNITENVIANTTVNNRTNNFNGSGFLCLLICNSMLYILPKFRYIHIVSAENKVYYREIIASSYSDAHAAITAGLAMLYLFGKVGESLFNSCIHYSCSFFTIDIIYTIIDYIIKCGDIEEQINKLLRKSRNRTNNFENINNELTELTKLQSDKNKLYYKTIGFIIHHISAIIGYLLVIYKFNVFNEDSSANLMYFKYVVARLLLSEISTPFLNLCWKLKSSGMENTQVMVNTLVLTVILYFAFRIVNFSEIMIRLIINMYLLQSFMLLPLIYLNFVWYHKLCVILFNKIEKLI
jgi:hypothetical protein